MSLWAAHDRPWVYLCNPVQMFIWVWALLVVDQKTAAWSPETQDKICRKAQGGGLLWAKQNPGKEKKKVQKNKGNVQITPQKMTGKGDSCRSEPHVMSEEDHHLFSSRCTTPHRAATRKASFLPLWAGTGKRGKAWADTSTGWLHLCQ